MNAWVQANLDLLTSVYPTLQQDVVDGVQWIRIADYGLPPGVWKEAKVELAFRIPAEPGEAPYAFWVKPGLSLLSGATIKQYVFPAATPWGDDWGQFSFAPEDAWQPKADVGAGANMVNFAFGIADRLREGG
jgi:hypothetical protein